MTLLIVVAWLMLVVLVAAIGILYQRVNKLEHWAKNQASPAIKQLQSSSRKT